MWLNTCRFTRSIIKSRAAMTYQEAQTRIDDERLNDEVTLGLRRMNAVAKVLRKRRAERWAEQRRRQWVHFCKWSLRGSISV